MYFHSAYLLVVFWCCCCRHSHPESLKVYACVAPTKKGRRGEEIEGHILKAAHLFPLSWAHKCYASSPISCTEKERTTSRLTAVVYTSSRREKNMGWEKERERERRSWAVRRNNLQEKRYPLKCTDIQCVLVYEWRRREHLVPLLSSSKSTQRHREDFSGCERLRDGKEIPFFFLYQKRFQVQKVGVSECCFLLLPATTDRISSQIEQGLRIRVRGKETVWTGKPGEQRVEKGIRSVSSDPGNFRVWSLESCLSVRYCVDTSSALHSKWIRTKKEKVSLSLILCYETSKKSLIKSLLFIWPDLSLEKRRK